MLKWVKGIALIFALSGCKFIPVRHIAQSPAVSVTPSGGVLLSGDSPSPAKVNSSKSDSVMPIPEGSTFAFNEKLGTMVLTVSKATSLALNRTETRVEGPVAFTPDKAPTIAEEKNAQANFWVKLGLQACVLIGGAAAIFGLVKDWNLVMYGGIAVCVSGLFGLFVQAHPILLLFIGLGVALKFVGPIIWHTKLKPDESTPNASK